MFITADEFFFSSFRWKAARRQQKAMLLLVTCRVTNKRAGWVPCVRSNLWNTFFSRGVISAATFIRTFLSHYRASFVYFNSPSYTFYLSSMIWPGILACQTFLNPTFHQINQQWRQATQLQSSSTISGNIWTVLLKSRFFERGWRYKQETKRT